jgi:hypothetical protein
MPPNTPPKPVHTSLDDAFGKWMGERKLTWDMLAPIMVRKKWISEDRSCVAEMTQAELNKVWEMREVLVTQYNIDTQPLGVTP